MHNFSQSSMAMLSMSTVERLDPFPSLRKIY